ncbi:DUF559 domain-containing protein [Candidatus Peregrinibacteria bacterium]|nr:DUF559 domain-containing protein [Candidatus Peregrinibacteria bacterium]
MKFKEVTRELRRNQTKAEKIFWEAVRSRKIDGKKIVRQFAISFQTDEGRRFFVADFYCAEARLIIEIDGDVHDVTKEHDQLRTDLLKQIGFRVIRFKNEDILERLDRVIEELRKPSSCLSIL